MEFTKNRSVGSYVADNYKAASVFQKYGIDFCCRGGISIEEVSAANNIDADKLLAELEEALSEKDTTGIDFRSWPLDLLADYIEKKHHRYIERTVPALNQYLTKICEVHGARHPELPKIREAFNTAASNLSAHMQKEEMILFPYIRKMVASKESGEKMDSGFWTVKNPIHVMMSEHDAEGERFRLISSLSNNYTAPEDACKTYEVSFALLKEFEADLHLHIHLENNILFPGAIAMEATLMNA
jgi:regulator of cell morphogenesis and NO signaling